MKSIKLSVIIAMGLAGSAQADALEDLKNGIAPFAEGAADQMWTDYSLRNRWEPAKCTEVIARARKLGVAETDTMKHGKFKVHPKAKDESKPYESIFVITVADTDWICEEYTRARDYAKLRVDVQKAYDLADWMRLVKPEEAGSVEGMSKKPQACLDALDTLEKQGKKPSDTLLIEKEKNPVTLEQARRVCTVALEDAKKFEGAVTGRETKQREELEAIYKKVGVKGKRLELFVYYGKPEDGSFLAPGCESFVTTAAGLKKAKKLFIWLTANDGAITVRKYTFKGDNYTTAERTFYSETAAYRYCR